MKVTAGLTAILFAILVGLLLSAGCGGGGASVVITLAPNPIQVQPGATTAVIVTVLARTDPASSLQLAVSGLPTGVTGAFDKAVLSPFESTAVLTLAADATAIPSTYSGIIVTATELSNPRAAGSSVLVLRVVPAGSPDLFLNVTPSGQTLSNTAGANTTFSVFVGALNGFSGTVGLTVSGAPSGISITGPTPSTFQVPPNGVSSLVVTVMTPLATAQTFTLTVTATSGSIVKVGTASVQLN